MKLYPKKLPKKFLDQFLAHGKFLCKIYHYYLKLLMLWTALSFLEFVWHPQYYTLVIYSSGYPAFVSFLCFLFPLNMRIPQD